MKDLAHIVTDVMRGALLIALILLFVLPKTYLIFPAVAILVTSGALGIIGALRGTKSGVYRLSGWHRATDRSDNPTQFWATIGLVTLLSATALLIGLLIAVTLFLAIHGIWRPYII
jgi:hypothetical protein